MSTIALAPARVARVPWWRRLLARFRRAPRPVSRAIRFDDLNALLADIRAQTQRNRRRPPPTSIPSRGVSRLG